MYRVLENFVNFGGTLEKSASNLKCKKAMQMAADLQSKNTDFCSNLSAIPQRCQCVQLTLQLCLPFTISILSIKIYFVIYSVIRNMQGLYLILLNVIWIKERVKVVSGKNKGRHFPFKIFQDVKSAENKNNK